VVGFGRTPRKPVGAALKDEPLFSIFGAFLILLALVGASTGELWGPYGTVTYRDENPKEFWWSVAGCFFLGIFSIVVDVLKVPRDIVIGILFVGVFVYCAYLLLRWITRPK
jgi:hypothetical protein